VAEKYLSGARPVPSEAILRYRTHRALPYLLPVTWLGTSRVLVQSPDALLLAEDETGNPRRKPIVLMPDWRPGRSLQVDEFIDRAADVGPPGARLVVMGTADELRGVRTDRWTTDFDWWGMCRDVHDPGPSRRAVSLADRPRLVPAAWRLWNSAGFGDPVPAEKGLAMARHHPLWLAANTYVVPDGDFGVAAVVRVHVEEGADGRFGFLRGLVVAAEVRSRASFPVLFQLYAAVMDRLLGEGVRRCHLKVAARSVRLQHLYRILGFRAEERIQEISLPVWSRA
jgi:hypothetical protein